MRSKERGKRQEERGKNKGFTLIEIMVTVVFLAMGTLMLQESFFRSAALYSRYANTLKAKIFAHEKLWEAKEASVYSEDPVSGSESGTFVEGGRTFDWSLRVDQPKETFFLMTLDLQWQESGKPVSLTRQMIVAKIEKKPGA